MSEEQNVDANNENTGEDLQDDNSSEHVDQKETTDAGKEQSEEADGGDEGSGGDESGDETVEISKAEFERLQKRAKAKAIKDRIKGKKDSEKGSEESYSQEELTNALLEVRGVKEDDERDLVIKLAKQIGLKPTDALNDDYVQSKLAGLRKQKSDAVASGGSGASAHAKAKGADYWIAKGEMPKDKVEAAKVRDELARRAKEGA